MTTASGARVAKVSLATNRVWVDGQGQKQEKVAWHRLTFFGKLVDIVEQWVHKGDALYVEGRIEYSQTEGEDGVTRYWTDIVVNEMNMLGSSNSEPREEKRQEEPKSDPPPLSEPDDDLPF